MKYFGGILVAVVVATLAWPDLDVGKLGRNLVDSTGVVSSSQIDSALAASEKVRQASKTLSDEQEYYLGRAVAALVLQKYPLYRSNNPLTNYLNIVGNVLVYKSPRPETFGGFHFGILDTPEINALSTPGGFVFVSRGFLEITPSEDALAGILAHEIGHVVLGHGVKAISQSKLSDAALILGKEAVSSCGSSEVAMLQDLFGESVNQVADTLMKTGYSRSQEYEADTFAANLLVKAGYSAKGLRTMIDELAKVSGKRGGWLDTHPSPADRKAALKLPKQVEDQSALQARTARYQNVPKS